MSTNYHTPYMDDVTLFKASYMETPLGELDAAITILFTLEVLQTIVPGASVTIDWSQGRKAYLLLNQNTVINFENAVDGQVCILILQQDGTGSRIPTWTSGMIRGSVDLAFPPILTNTINKTDYLGFIYRAGPNKYDFLSLTRGF